MENRKNFYDKDDFNRERAEKGLDNLISLCNLKECLWVFSNITYDQVCWYDETLKGIVYKGKYTDKQISQATGLQRRISESCDLFSQVILNNREFEDEYIELFTHSRAIIENLKSKIERLEEKINYMKNIEE